MKSILNNDKYVSTRNDTYTGEPRRQWIQYADGVIEPVRKDGNLNKKHHDSDPRKFDWWTMEKPLDWDPVKEGKQVSLNHDYGAKKESAKPAKSPDKPAKPAPKSTLGQGAASFWEYEAKRKAEAEKKERRSLNTNKLDELGISWGGKNRSLIDGPKYGNYGGKKHTGGSNGKEQPIDTSDRMYKQHDLGWAECEKLPKSKQGMYRERHDTDLVRRLEGLPDDAIKWPYPPPRELRKDAEKFRKGAIYWFKK